MSKELKEKEYTTHIMGNPSNTSESATWSEILSQPDIWQKVLQSPEVHSTVDALLGAARDRTTWLYVGCGTSYYLAEAAALTAMKLTGRPARVLPASEVLLQPELVRAEGGKLQAVVISRSGKTSEAVRAAAALRDDLRVPTFGITCAQQSPLEKACDQTLVLHQADESSTVMTRSFTSMLLALQLLAARRAGNQAFVRELSAMAAAFSPQLSALADRIRNFVQSHQFEDYVFLAQGASYGIAREAALKVMEMSCSYSQFFHTLEFRHGPKAIVSAETCLTFYLDEPGYQAEAEVLAEMKQLGGVNFTICNRATESVRNASDFLVELDLPASELGLLAPSVVPSQLLGLFTGLRKGLNPDAPKNLTRVVMLD